MKPLITTLGMLFLSIALISFHAGWVKDNVFYLSVSAVCFWLATDFFLYSNSSEIK